MRKSREAPMLVKSASPRAPRAVVLRSTVLRERGFSPAWMTTTVDIWVDFQVDIRAQGRVVKASRMFSVATLTR
jgi:hypothetical protein